MSKQRQIKNFISITQTTDEVANYYMNHFYDVNEAVEAFFNNPLTLPSDMKVKRETPNKEKHIIFKTFEKYAENNVLSGENFTKFKEELKIEELPFSSYLIGYLSKANELEFMKKDDCLRMMTNVCFSNDVKNDFIKENERVIQREYHKYMIYIHLIINRFIHNSNKENKSADERGDVDMNKSFADRTAENQIQFIDVLEDILREILPEKYTGNKVFELIIEYIRDTKKRLSVTKDEFSFIVDFLNEFTEEKKLKMTDDQIDEKCYLPQLYTDFLEFYNKK